MWQHLKAAAKTDFLSYVYFTKCHRANAKFAVCWW